MSNTKMNSLLPKSKGSKRITQIGIVTSAIAFSVIPTFAATDLLDNIKNVIGNYYSTLAGIAVGLGALMAVVAIIMWLVFPSDKAAEKGKTWFTRIMFCIGIILCLGGIIGLVQNVTEGAGFDAQGYVNSIPSVGGH